MKKGIYILILSLVVVSGLVYANREIKFASHKVVSEAAEKPFPKPLTEAERREARKNWEATPEGVKFKEWEESPAGIKVLEGVAKINKQVREYTNMAAVVTSLSLPPGSHLGFGVMANINGVDYILRFDDDSQGLRSLKVNDRIMIRARVVSYAPKYAYPIVAGEYAERDGKVLYKHAARKDGC